MECKKKEDSNFTMTTLVYLAGGYRDERMPFYMTRLTALPQCEITWDWTKALDLPADQAAQHDLEGVSQCNLFVAVMDLPEYEYRGTFTELGAALALNKPVVIVRSTVPNHASTNCFFSHPNVFYAESFDAVERLIMTRSKLYPKLLVLGAGRHGKDTLAEVMERKGGYTFTSSSEAANSTVIYPVLCQSHRYQSEKECFEDRHNHRKLWYNLICLYNKEDKARLAREILQNVDIYVGMRSSEELEASRPLFDLVLWVDAEKRITEKDPTLMIERNQADLCIDNNGTLDEFINRTRRLLSLLKCPK
jgi:nucleoside 2-deoxyribosyltransferase